MKLIFNPFTANFDYVDGIAGSGFVTSSSTPSVNNSVARYDGTSGTVIQDSKALLQDGGAFQAQGYVGRKEIADEVIIPDKHFMVATGLTILNTGSVQIGADSELLLI